MQGPPLSRDELRQLLDYSPESGVFTWKVNVAKNVKPGQPAGSLHPDGYIRIRFLGRAYFAHRLAWLFVNGEWNDPKTAPLDHINRVKSDNRIANLRLATRSENMQNIEVKRDNSSGFKGVCSHGDGKWRALIRVGGKQLRLGTFSSPEEAYAAYQAAARQHHSTNTAAC